MENNSSRRLGIADWMLFFFQGENTVDEYMIITFSRENMNSGVFHFP
jgi:hypothetical protein